MLSESLVDLDELVLRCRNNAARSYIAEAVLCYRAGAFRQSIIATWIAVVYDFLDKLQELDQAGDPAARKTLHDYREIARTGDIRRSLEFERQLLDIAQTGLQLISDVERIDLERLQEDRNRCAHPALNAFEEFYEPSPELARTHLRNAVDHMLKRPPVQGKAALDRLLGEVRGEYFPTSSEDAEKHFESGPLSRPKASLVRNFVIVMIKTLVLGECSDASGRRHNAALLAVRRMHRHEVEATLAADLNELFRRVPDAELFRPVTFVSKVDDTWQYLKADVRQRLQEYVLALPRELFGRRFVHVEAFPPFRDDEDFRGRVIDSAVTRYENAASFQQANDLGEFAIVPLARRLTPGEVKRIVHAASVNSQILGSFQWDKVLTAIHIASILPEQDLQDLLSENHLSL